MVFSKVVYLLDYVETFFTSMKSVTRWVVRRTELRLLDLQDPGGRWVGTGRTEIKLHFSVLLNTFKNRTESTGIF